MKSFREIISGLLPTKLVTRLLDLRQEPAAIAHTMDVDRIAGILRQAEGGDLEDYFALSRDVIGGHTHTQAEFGKRKLAVIGEDMVVSAIDDDNEADVSVAEAIADQLGRLDNLLDVLLHLLDSTLYPVALVEKIYRPSNREGWRYELAELRPVPHRLLDWTEGELLIWDTDERGNKISTKHCPDPIRYIIHRGHAFTNLPDTWGGPMRAVLFWWLFATMSRTWWARFLDRYGAPFMVAKYDETDDAARYTLAQAFQSASKLFGLAVPKHVELQLVQAQATSAGDAFEKFQAVANQELSKVIIGQTLSAQGQNLGLGGGQASVQENVRQDIRQFDSRRLGHTLRTQLARPLCQLNGWVGRPPKFAWGGESAAELDAIGSILPGLSAAGLELDDEGVDVLSQRLGLGLRRSMAVTPGADPAFSPLAAGRRTPGPTPAGSERARTANEDIATAGAPDLAKALSASLAPVARLLADSDSLDDFEQKLRARFPDLDRRQASALVEEALTANAANAILNSRQA